MRKLLAISGDMLFAVMLCLLLGTAQAEDATFSEAELDQMMAPIAERSTRTTGAGQYRGVSANRWPDNDDNKNAG